MYQTQFEGTVYVDQNVISETYQYDTNPRMEFFKNDQVLGSLTLKDMSGKDLNTPSNMQRHEIHLRPQTLPDKKITLKFESVDTEELKNVEITFNGDRQIFKVGEGEANHY